MYKISKEQLEQLGQLLNTVQVQGQQSIISMATIIQILSKLEGED